MNRLGNEFVARRPDWIEGTWITLADGCAWSFPPPSAIPGYQVDAKEVARQFVDTLLPLLTDAMSGHYLSSQANPKQILAQIGRAFAMHQIVFRVGCLLLKRNYDLDDSEFQALMPFDYQLDEFWDPLSKVHQATPETLAMAVKVAEVLEVDIAPELARITASN